jgi:aminoglycoside/choline kinase family phosphotransferase
MHARENALKEWVSTIVQHKDFTLTPLAGDASFRRYFRVQYNELTQIVMDAPPEKEDLSPFIHIAKILSNFEVIVPEIIAMNLQQGFLLLSDFGDVLLLNALHERNVDKYYCDAIKTILHIQNCPIDDPRLPSFDKTFMLKEIDLCSEWFFNAYLSLNLKDEEILVIQNTANWLATEVSNQPLSFIHRDYHSRNLMLIERQTLGVIDFQDAMRGPVTYDLVSLLKDCYISWPREKVLEWVSYFHKHSRHAGGYSLAEFIRAFDLCGLQRHLKVLGIFCRLYLRDGKAGYLLNIPLTLNYVFECSELYNELNPFFNFLQNRVKLP